jgi:hypothetical protein
MKQTIVWFLTLSLLLLILFSDVHASETNSWYPLSVGNYWEYDESDGGKLKILVASSKDINGELNFAVQRISLKGAFAGKGAYQTSILAEYKDGIVVFGKIVFGQIMMFKEPCFDLSYPLVLGKKWEYTPVYADIPTPIRVNVSSEVIAVNEVLDTPAGHFKTAKIKIQTGKILYYRWYAQGIGLVKEVYKPHSIKREKILTSYHVNGAEGSIESPSDKSGMNP